MTPRRSHRLALLAVLALAASLRYAAIGWGRLRHDLAVDESRTIRMVYAQLESGSFDTRDYFWPNLNVYLSTAAIHTATFLIRPWRAEPLNRLAVGRSVAATSGVLTVLLVYLAASRLADRRSALCAAALLAASPLSLDRSRIWLTDAPMAMFYTLTLWLTARILDRPTALRFALAGVAAGLATGTKYNGAGACLLIPFACLARRGYRPGVAGAFERASKLALAAALALACFFLSNPYALLDFAEFRADMSVAVQIYTGEPPTGFLGYHGIRYVLLTLWRWGLGRLPSLLALAGMGYLLHRRTPESLLIAIPPVLYLVFYSTTLRYPLARNFLPLLSHFVIAAAVGLGAMADAVERWACRLHPRLPLARPLILAALLVAALPGIGETIGVRQSDTRLDAASWILQHVPPGARVRYELSMVRVPYERFHTERHITSPWKQGIDRLALDTDYVVVTSDLFAYVCDQRDRPGFAERASVYDALFRGDRFERVARFRPDLTGGGPEVRIYRNRARPRPELGAGCIDLGDRLPSNYDWRRRRRARPPLRFDVPWRLYAGSVFLREAGRYELTVKASAAAAFPLQVGLGGRERRYFVAGETTIVHPGDLPAGPAWFHLEVGRGWDRETPALVTQVSLCRIEPRDVTR